MIGELLLEETGMALQLVLDQLNAPIMEDMILDVLGTIDIPHTWRREILRSLAAVPSPGTRRLLQLSEEQLWL